MASTKKDMRREDLIIPYVDLEKDKETTDFNSTMSSTLPMAAIFTRNKYLGWTAVLFSVQNWLSESKAQQAAASTPAFMSIGMAVLSLGVSYLPFFLPPPPGAAGQGSATGAPAAAPLSV